MRCCVKCYEMLSVVYLFFSSRSVSVYHTPLSNRHLILMTRSAHVCKTLSHFFCQLKAKSPLPLSMHAEAPLIPSQGTPSKHPRGACVVTHLHCKRGTIKYKQQFLWVIRISRTAGRNCILLLLPLQLVRSPAER